MTAGVAPYDQAYFDRYASYEGTPIADRLNAARVSFVERHWKGTVVDIGVGSGAFIKTRSAFAARCLTAIPERRTLGFDVNPVAVEWLKSVGLFADVHAGEWRSLPAVTFWDTLEHIPDFRPLIDNVVLWAFVSIPIFVGPFHALASKHFRKDEHCWYFTEAGLVRVFDELGFDCVERNTDETAAGRDGIGSFAFRRRRQVP